MDPRAWVGGCPEFAELKGDKLVHSEQELKEIKTNGLGFVRISKMGGQPWVRMRLAGIEKITQTVLKFWKMCRECRKA